MDKVARATQEIGRRLRSARAGAGLTLAVVARQAGVSEGFLSKLERGQAAASIANLIQLADVLGVFTRWKMAWSHAYRNRKAIARQIRRAHIGQNKRGRDGAAGSGSLGAEGVLC